MFANVVLLSVNCRTHFSGKQTSERKEGLVFFGSQQPVVGFRLLNQKLLLPASNCATWMNDSMYSAIIIMYIPTSHHSKGADPHRAT
jgi:hypothetical protein